MLTLAWQITTAELQINFFVDFSRGQSVPSCSFLPNGPPELRKAIEIPSTMTAQPLHGLALHDGVGIKMHPIVWAGEAAYEVVLGF
jgi:hypothetical protein